jgi:hypothetical protein
MTTITGEAASETDATRAPGRAAPVTQRGPKAGKVRLAWKAAAKAAGAPAPVTRRRRRGDGRAKFSKAARGIGRRPPPPSMPAEMFSWNFWDNQWQQAGLNADDFSPLSGFSAGDLHL